MGVFEFIIALVLISTLGKVLGQRLPRERPTKNPPQIPSAETERIREAIEELSGRLMRLEDERDFYRQLLEAPDRERVLQPPTADPGPGEKD